MESRKITIISSATQSRKTIMTSATTLGELKAELDAAGISYSGLSFNEGLTKTELKDNSSILPVNVPYKGTVTNELVFLLTSNTKIKSGVMTRPEMYAEIKSKGLGDAVKAKYGKNYTNCTTVELQAFLVKNPKGFKQNPTPVVEEEVVVTTKPSKDTSVVESQEKVKPVVDEVCREVLTKLINLAEDMLQQLMHATTPTGSKSSEVEVEKKLASTYKDSEIDDMFKFVK